MKVPTPVLVFAKAPIPGQVKTRLCPALSRVAAARLATRLLARTLRTALAADIGPVTLVAAPDPYHPELARLVHEFGIEATSQSGGDLGERMYTALVGALERTDRCILIGADCIDLQAGDLEAATRMLAAGTDVVLGPSVDGGYVLIGARRVVPALFENITWSSSAVMSQTRDAILAHGWSLECLRLLRDIDEPRDLALLPRHWQLP